MKIRRSAAVALVTAFPLAAGFAGAGEAAAHGTSQNPPSRIQLCSTQGGENPENFTLSACRAAKAAVGDNPQPFYDPNAVNIAQAAGNHRQLIPDGKLCSANNAQYAGLDLPRTDWPTTNLPSGGAYTFLYKATAPHKGSFEYYITKDGFDVTKPLKWSDLEAKPFATATDPQLQNGAYVIKGQLPKKSGRHLIYIVWQRSDSPEAFYSCSDVVFDGSGKPAPTAPAGTSGGSANTSGGTSGGHTGHDAATPAGRTPAGTNPQTSKAGSAAPQAAGPASAAPPGAADADVAPAAQTGELARTGGGGASVGLLAGGAGGVLALGAGSLIYARRRAHR